MFQVKVPGSFEVQRVPRGFRGSKVPKKQVKVPGSSQKVSSLPERVLKLVCSWGLTWAYFLFKKWFLLFFWL